MLTIQLLKNVSNHLLFLFFFCFISIVDTQAQRQTNDSELIKIVDQFKKGIQNKDSLLFMELFLNDSIPWVGISHPESWVQARKIYPNLKQVDYGNCRSFIRFVVNYPGPIIEKFFNEIIVSDGVLATIAFDYSLWRKGEPYGWGKETWSLLKIEENWKIVAVYYSGMDHKVSPIPLHYY